MQNADNQTEKKKRLKEVRIELGLKQEEMAKELDTTRPNLSRVENLDPKRNVPKGTSMILEKKFGVNSGWFETGLGPMFNEKKGNATLIGQIPEDDDPDTKFIEISPGRYEMKIHYVKESAKAGYLSGFFENEPMRDLPYHKITVDEYNKGNYMAFDVDGDSMDDDSKRSIPHGSIISGREIKRELWVNRFHTHRYPYYIFVHKREGIIVKEIINHNVADGIVTLHSINPDKNRYPDFDVHLDDVFQIFNVVKKEETY